jgi:hypothetical protein
MKNIRPTGRKGKEVLDRMKSLMGKAPINENQLEKSKVEISKLAPDNKVYAIIRENHEYYIKTSEKIANLMLEDFNYIGGLPNKKSHAHNSYASALKQLNLKMISLNEQYGGDKINVFENDNLISADGSRIADEEECEDCMEENSFIEEEITKCTCGANPDGPCTGDGQCSMQEAELKVKAVQDGPKSLKGNSIGDYEEVTDEPDKAPNDKSTGTVKGGEKEATPKKTIKETRKPKFSILGAMEKMDSIFESASKKKI